ncbi:hypothetical protein HDU78_010565 [Chytriomyces hyalinus]|nr:hypothetical protein HDU78_010565 [Chytriomyces hyalinus]
MGKKKNRAPPAAPIAIAPALNPVPIQHEDEEPTSIESANTVSHEDTLQSDLDTVDGTPGGVDTDHEDVFALEFDEAPISKSDLPSQPPPDRESDTAQLPSHSRNNVETIESTPVSLSAAHFQMPQSLARNAPIKQSARRTAKQRNPPSSSLISQLGSIVKGSLTGTSSTSPQSPPFNAKSPESILWAKFVRIRFWDSQREKNVANFTDDGNMCLLVGYERGFQVWSISSSLGTEFSQLVSVRNELQRVIDLDVVPYPSIELQKEIANTDMASSFPLIAVVESAPESPTNAYAVKLYSLNSHRIVKEWNFTANVLSVKCSSNLIAVGLSDNTIQIYSALSLKPVSCIPDAYPVFTVGSRLLIYASTVKPPKPQPLSKANANTKNGEDFDEWVLHSHQSIMGAGSQPSVGDKAIDGLKRATGKVVKEVLGGANYLGAVGYTAVQNYLQNGTTTTGAEEISVTQATDASNAPPHLENSKAEGVIAIREFPLDIHFESSSSDDLSLDEQSTLISHWKAHTNKISYLTLNEAQTLLFTSSTSANTFFIFSLNVASPLERNLPRNRSVNTLMPQNCLYKLERGFTPATIESVSFSSNGKWCAVSTARGTTHVYALPQVRNGGKDLEKVYELGVINGWTDAKAGNVDAVNAALYSVSGAGNAVANPWEGVSIYPAARLKQNSPLATTVAVHDAGEKTSAKDLVDAGASGRAALSVAFFFDRVSSNAPANGASGRRDSGAGLLANAVSGIAASPNLPGFLGGGILDSDFTKLFRQRMVSVHPSGFATLHHLDVGAYVHRADHSPNASVGSYGNSPGVGFSASPKNGSWAGLHQHHHGAAKIQVKDVMQWDINRCRDWAEYKPDLQASRAKSPPWKLGTWASQIETTTYDTIAFGPPIWADPVFKLHMYSTDPAKRGLSKTAQGPDLSDLPTFHALETIREIVKPAGTRADTYPSLRDSVFVDNDISSAMGDQPFSGANGVTTPVWRKEGLSFEDALVVDNTIAPPELGDHLSESQFGYNLYKMAKKYTTQ